MSVRVKQHPRIACAALLLSTCVSVSQAQDGNNAPSKPSIDISRIVSVGGAVTETLYALGLDKNIVGVDTTSLYPPQALREKPSVGYMRQLSAEGVLGLRPSVIMMVDGSGPKDTLGVLQAAGVPMLSVHDAFTADSIIDKIAVIGKATGTMDRAQCLISRVRDDLADLTRFAQGITARKRVMFILSLVNGRAMVAGRHTAADGIIAMAGAVNAIGDYEGYKAINDEAVIAAKPDVVLAIDRSDGNSLNAESVFANTGMAATPAGQNRAFVAMESLYLMGFGPRTARAARELSAAVYPDLKAPSSSTTGDHALHGCND